MNKKFAFLPLKTQKFLNTILDIEEVTLREMSGIKYTILDTLIN